MANVLLIIPPGIRPRAARDRAIEEAKHAGGKLIALLVLDPVEADRIAASLDSAFLGERVSERVVEVLEQEQRRGAELVLADIEKHAKAAAVPFLPIIEEGDPTDVCARVIRQHAVGSALLVVEKRSWVTRFLARSAPVKIPSLSGCDVRVMEEPETRGRSAGEE
jgi:nucleotide-binding universal stress UspA family protein